MLRHRLLIVLIAIIIAFSSFGEASAQGPFLLEIYPELQRDGVVRTVGRWSNGTYTIAASEYPELRPNGAVVYVWFWTNGTYSVAIDQYPELRPDGSIWFVRLWEDGVYTAIMLSGPTAVSPPAPPPPVTAPPPGGVRYPGVGYGMQIDPGNDINRSLGLLRNAGFSWVKVQLRWENLEPSKGNISWGPIDRAVEAANAHGVRLLFSVVTAPTWARPANTDFSVPGPPANPQDFADFVGAIAARHRGKVHAIEVWNEQNVHYEWGGLGNKLNAAQYIDLLRHAYAAIKANDPNIVVVSGAPTPTGVNDGNIAYDDVVYLRMMYQNGLKNYSDAIGAHPSGYNNAPDDTPDSTTCCGSSFKGHWSFYYRRFEQFRQVMEEFGDTNKQIWFTEFGWASAAGDIYPDYLYARDISEQTQADFLVRAFEIARERGYIGPMFVWNLNYGPIADPGDRWAMRAFSIIRADWSPRPAYHALAAMPK